MLDMVSSVRRRKTSSTQVGLTMRRRCLILLSMFERS